MRIPVDNNAVHSASNDHLEQRVVQYLGDRAAVREAVRVVRVQLLVQHHHRDLDGRQDVLARGRVVDGGDRRALAYLRGDVDERLAIWNEEAIIQHRAHLHSKCIEKAMNEKFVFQGLLRKVCHASLSKRLKDKKSLPSKKALGPIN